MAATHKPRAFEIREATREAVNLKLGLFAPSGGGKTFSALELATGIQSVVGGDIALIDTENRRGLHYADRFAFRHIDFKPPYGSLDYIDAIKAAAKAGCKTIVVDSMSHEHEGPGGMLEFQEAEVDRLAGDNANWQRREAVKMLAWQKPKQARRALLNQGILGVDANLILCFRAKNTAKPIMKTGDDGRRKTEVVQQGFMPVAGDEFVFEMDLCALLLPAAAGVATWASDNPGESMMIKVPVQFESVKTAYAKKPLDRALGSQLATWATGGGKRKAAPPADQRTASDAAPRTSPGTQETEVAPPAAAAQASAPELALDGGDGFPGDQPAPKPKGPPETWSEYAEAVAEADAWPAVVGLIEAFARTVAYKDAGEDMRAKGRVIAWRRLQDLNHIAQAKKLEPLDFLSDAQAFRCYLAVETNGAALDHNRRTFESGEIFAALPAGAKDAFKRAGDARANFILNASKEESYQ